jgi:hypothetical protein
MTTSLARPAHWDDPDPVPGFRLHRRNSDLGAGEVWEALAKDSGPVLVRLVDLPDDGISRAKAGRFAGELPKLGHPDLDPVRQIVATSDGLALIRPPAAEGVTTLSMLLARRRALTAGEIAGLADRLGRALGYLHDRGVTHGRLSAADVLLRPSGRPVLTGYGVAGIQGAGGLPAEDVATLSALLLANLSVDAGPETTALRTLLTTVAGSGADGHEFADEVLGCADPAPIRTRPSPGRPLLLVGSKSSTVPSLSRAGTSSPPTASEPSVSNSVDTLDAAVRALRAGARQSADRPRVRPGARTARVPGSHRVREPANKPLRPGRQAQRWLSRVTPAAAILVVAVLVTGLMTAFAGWRFLAPATAGARETPVAPATPAPDLATITRLDAARSAAFASGATERLTAADAPNSAALASDVDAMSIMLSHQGRARGLAPRINTVAVLSRSGDRAVVRVVDELPPYDFVTTTGRIIARSPGHSRQVHDVRLRLVSGQWRYEAVTKPGAMG